MRFGFLAKLRKIKFPAVNFPGIFLVFPDRKSSDVEGGKHTSKAQVVHTPALVLDTSAIIDGRIADIITTGFIDGTMVVPSCVLRELQRIADSDNKIKRARGRRGLDILNEIKKSKQVDFRKFTCEPRNGESVDVAILRLAEELNGKIVTTDYNLNKIGKVSDVPILNVNELANMVKTIILPGEELSIEIIQPGKGDNQGVGYLPDGTMVVVEEGVQYIGQEIKAEVKRLLQTDAGRMIFARPL